MMKFGVNASLLLCSPHFRIWSWFESAGLIELDGIRRNLIFLGCYLLFMEFQVMLAPQLTIYYASRCCNRLSQVEEDL